MSTLTAKILLLPLWCKVLLGAVVTFVLIFGFFRVQACRHAAADAAYWQGLADQLKKDNAELGKTIDTNVSFYEADKKKWDTDSKKLRDERDLAQHRIDILYGNVDSLNGELAKMEGELKLAKTCEEQLAVTRKISTALVAENKTLRLVIEEKDKQIVYIDAQYQGEHKLRLNADKIIADQVKLLVDKDLQIKAIEKSLVAKDRQIAGLSIFGNLGKVETVALAALAGYMVFKK